jgi:phosphoserine aminotransferase
MYNFGAGPSSLYKEAKEKLIQDLKQELSLTEITYVDKKVQDLIYETTQLFREVAEVPDTHEILWVNGSARLLFAAIPMNLYSLKGSALFVDSGKFSNLAAH